MKALLILPILFLSLPVQAQKSPEACFEIIRGYYQLREAEAFEAAEKQVELLVDHCDSYLNEGSEGLLELKRLADNDAEYTALTDRLKAMGLWQ